MKSRKNVTLSAILFIVCNLMIPLGTQARPGFLSGGVYIREVPGWSDRPYIVHIPAALTSSMPAPVILVLHGGGGTAEEMDRLTCPRGKQTSPQCFSRMANRKGFVVVYPNGTARKFLGHKLRTWNAGGGKQNWSCVSGVACKNRVDDIAYFKALLNDLHTIINVDDGRICAAGISNGAAMVHRLACEMGDRIAEIVAIAGGNQFSALRSCHPEKPVAVLGIHGTADKGWPIDGGKVKGGFWSRFVGATHGRMFSVRQTITDWAARNGCSVQPETDKLPVFIQDGTSVTRSIYSGCKKGAHVVFYEIVGGGHTWPLGYQYFPVWMVGRTTHNLSANKVILDFFEKMPRR
jgi:polyhydroxybutyrate depolymerase